MQTRPIPLAALDAAGGLDEFRVGTSRDVAALLQRLADGSVALTLSAGERSDGAAAATLVATVWSADAARGTLGLAVDAADPALRSLVDAGDAVAVGYLDNVKLQFDLQRPVLVRGPRASVLDCAYPAEVYRFQRRHAYRVRPLLRSTPVVRVRHSEIPEMQLALRVLDVSIGGCALFLPDDVPPLRPGVVLNQVQIELDADTRFRTDLRLQHVSSTDAEAHGVRLGCEFVGPAGETLRALQRFIDQTQKRGRLLAPT